MDHRRVVITGIGPVTPIGIGCKAVATSLRQGRSGVARFEPNVDHEGLKVDFGAQVKRWDPSPWLNARETRRLSRNSQFAVVATRRALEDSGLDLHADEALARRTGTILGTSAEFEWIYEGIVAFKTNPRGARAVNPLTATNAFPDAPAAHVALAHGAKGPNLAVSSACSSSLSAVGYSLDLIRTGRLDAVISGGSEVPLTPNTLLALSLVRALSTRKDEPETASRPFDATRDGLVAGEGAGIVILEELEHARRRGARMYGEVVGFGETCDASHIVAPDPKGREQARAVHLALEDAQLDTSDIDYIQAHGTSTPINDRTETALIKRVFGDRARQIPISSIKSMTGHLLGAAGGVGLVATLLGMEGGFFPPTINLHQPDPECDLDYVPNVARPGKMDVALVQSFGFGGKNAALAIRRFTG